MRDTTRRGPRRRSSSLAAVATGAVLAAGLLGGCSGSDDEPQSGPTPAPSLSTSVGSEPDEATAVGIGTVTGRLPKAEQREVADQVGAVVDRWYDAAYLGGDRSQTGGPSWAAAWPGFTRGAAAQARHDADLTSERRSDAGEVAAGSKAVRVDLLAVHQRPSAATAHVFLRYPVGDRSVRVTGRLYLTPSGTGWHVFGYDLSKGAAR